MRIENEEDVERAREQLRRWNRDSLESFLISLAGASGPAGEQVRTFIVGDDVAQTVDSVRERIAGLQVSHPLAPLPIELR